MGFPCKAMLMSSGSAASLSISDSFSIEFEWRYKILSFGYCSRIWKTEIKPTVTPYNVYSPVHALSCSPKAYPNIYQGWRCLLYLKGLMVIKEHRIKHNASFAFIIGPLHDLVTWCKNHKRWCTSCAVGLPNKGRSRWTGTSCTVLEVPLCNLHTGMTVWFCTMWPDCAKGLGLHGMKLWICFL